MAGQRTSWSLPYFQFQNYKFHTAASKNKSTNCLLTEYYPTIGNMQNSFSLLTFGWGAFRFKGTGFRQMISRTSCV